MTRHPVVLVPGYKLFLLPSKLYCISVRITPVAGLRAILSLGSKVIFLGNRNSLIQWARIFFVDAFRGIRILTFITSHLHSDERQDLLCN